MIVYGKHPVLSLLKSHPKTIKRLHLASQFRLPEGSIEGIPKEYCDADTLEKIAGDRHHQGAVAILDSFPYRAVEELIASSRTICLLDHIEDPGNLGSILRNAVGYGVDAIVIPSKRACEITSVTVKASAGTAFDIPVARVANLNDAISKIKSSGFWVYGFEAGQRDVLGQIRFDHKTAMVLGSEGAGLHALTKKRCDFLVTIEMCTQNISLNVAAASAIIFYTRYMQGEKP